MGKSACSQIVNGFSSNFARSNIIPCSRHKSTNRKRLGLRFPYYQQRGLRKACGSLGRAGLCFVYLLSEAEFSFGYLLYEF